MTCLLTKKLFIIIYIEGSYQNYILLQHIENLLFSAWESLLLKVMIVSGGHMQVYLYFYVGTPYSFTNNSKRLFLIFLNLTLLYLSTYIFYASVDRSSLIKCLLTTTYIVFFIQSCKIETLYNRPQKQINPNPFMVIEVRTNTTAFFIIDYQINLCQVICYNY